MVSRVKQAVVRVGGNVFGVVLNNVDIKHDENFYYYTSYYDYYGPREKESYRRAPVASTVSTNGADTDDSGSDEY